MGLFGNKWLNEGGALLTIIFFRENTFVVLQPGMQWQDIQVVIVIFFKGQLF